MYRHERYSATGCCNSSSNSCSSNSNSKQVTSQKKSQLNALKNQIKSTAAATTPWAPSCLGLPRWAARRGTRLARISRRPSRTRRGRSPSSQPRGGRKGPKREIFVIWFIHLYLSHVCECGCKLHLLAWLILAHPHLHGDAHCVAKVYDDEGDGHQPLLTGEVLGRMDYLK